MIEVALASSIALHRVVAELEHRDVRLPVRAADDLVDGLLDCERARLDQLGPVVKSEKVLE